MRAPRGSQISCKGWPQEAAMRLLMNSRDPEVAGPAAGQGSLHSVIAAIETLAGDQTLVIQPGKPPGIFQSNPSSPRVLILNNQPDQKEQRGEVGRWGQILFGATAGDSWTSRGDEPALCTSFMTFARAAQAHFGSDLAGKLVVAGGMGASGGAQPLAATMNEAAFLGIEVDERKVLQRVRSGFCDICVNDLDEALRILKVAVRQGQPISVGLVGNCAEIIPELARRGVVPDLLTDQTGSDDLLNGYVPDGMSVQQAAELRRSQPLDYLARSKDSMARHAAGMFELQKLGAAAFDFGNGLCAAAGGQGAMPHFVTAYLDPLLRAGIAPVRWFALSGEKSDIFRIHDVLLEIAPQNEILTHWLKMARKHLKFQGLPSRVCWLGAGERLQFGERANDLVARRELRAPMVISRDRLGSAPILMPAPRGEFGMVDGQAGRQFLAAIQEAASGASWAAFRCGSDAGKQQAFLTTQSVVADGTPEAARHISQILGGPTIVTE